MAKKELFYDENGNEILFHVNGNNELYFEIINSNMPDHTSHIILKSEDIEEMILMLTDKLNLIGKLKSE